MPQAAVIGELKQTPSPGQRLLHHTGAIIEFKLQIPAEYQGQAWLRSNLGRARVRWRELIAARESGQPVLEQDWHDLPMRRVDSVTFAIRLPLLQPGRFQAKAFLLSRNNHRQTLWPNGPNTVIKVEDGGQAAANTIYNSFVRQFGRPRETAAQTDKFEPALTTLDEHGYTVIPPSGKFRDLIRHLDMIIDQMGFRILQLLPIHPVPTTYARMGRFGSPFAALDLMDVDPALAVFDRQTTPMDQFLELVRAVHRRRARLFLDLPLNHTGWASSMQIHHPEWFVHGKSHRFRSPGAWGVTWEDLAELDYEQPSLWTYMAEVFLFWCRRGVDGFRCDAGYMLPLEAWEYMVAKVREQYPETTFLLEGLGGKMSVTRQLLDLADLDWAYSELFQNYDRGQIEEYLPGCLQTSRRYGPLIHFAETHDNNRLAAVSRQYARMRTALTGLTSVNGGFGIANGVEWLATEKIDVHGAPSLNWGSRDNLVAWITGINHLLTTHPAFFPGAEIRLLPSDGDNAVAILRQTGNPRDTLLILVNLDWQHPRDISWSAGGPDEPGWPPDSCFDLLSRQPCPLRHSDNRLAVTLQAGQVFCLRNGRPETPGPSVISTGDSRTRLPPRVAEQLLDTQILSIRQFYQGFGDVDSFDPAPFRPVFRHDPADCCRRLAGRNFTRLVPWSWPEDRNRIVVVPQNHLLVITADHHFTAELCCRQHGLSGRRCSLEMTDGRQALVLPVTTAPNPRFTRLGDTEELTLRLEIHDRNESRLVETTLLAAAVATSRDRIRSTFNRDDLNHTDLYALLTNDRSTMAQVRGGWAEIKSQYDSLLAANLHPDYPVDRQVLLTRCRAWIVNRGYSRELNRNSMTRFSQETDGTVVWNFAVPVGMGQTADLEIKLSMARRHNRINLQIRRFREKPQAAAAETLPDEQSINVILRPDIEDRQSHAKTKAFTGPEKNWPAAIAARQDGFTFTPGSEHRLVVRASKGSFNHEPEWLYMVAHPLEAERGLDDCSDLFSPGWFACELKGGEQFSLTAEAVTASDNQIAEPDTTAAAVEPDREEPAATAETMAATLHRAIRTFIVRRDDSRTVIAGYPWFLDWGRDTLISLRGIIAAGLDTEAGEILKQFGKFEKNGTLPNMIRGDDVSNRDTSDAPLWFFIACRDLLAHAGRDAFLEAPCDGRRTIRQVLISIAENYLRGTDNGIKVDPASSLVFSPSHFTWMDTNFPAGTPRQGYPIEIQALWIGALQFLDRIDPEHKAWKQLAERAIDSVHKFFTIPGQPWLADCLHADFSTAASGAVADNALRCNQLLAVTMGAIADRKQEQMIVAGSRRLLVPGAIRSLADQEVHPPLPIHWQGRLLNRPEHPYQGHYRGDEDTSRKPAYHNGTAWTWLFPSYCEALIRSEGTDAAATARALLTSGARCLLEQGCVGQLPEIVDGDAPHQQRGCGAQAWAATEYYRVLQLCSETLRER